MSRMFCTLEEAAQTLHADETQIHALLARGILHEFRDGPHRLVRAADVAALDLLRARPVEIQPPSGPSVECRRPSPRRSDRPKTNHATKHKRSSSATAVARPRRTKRTNAVRRKTAARRAKAPETRREPPDRLKCEAPLSRTLPAAFPPAFAPMPALHRPSPPAPDLSVRQWFWMGLVQDRPLAIALLSGLTLLALSALVAGICFLAEGRL